MWLMPCGMLASKQAYGLLWLCWPVLGMGGLLHLLSPHPLLGVPVDLSKDLGGGGCDPGKYAFFSAIWIVVCTCLIVCPTFWVQWFFPPALFLQLHWLQSILLTGLWFWML